MKTASPSSKSLDSWTDASRIAAFAVMISFATALLTASCSIAMAPDSFAPDPGPTFAAAVPKLTKPDNEASLEPGYFEDSEAFSWKSPTGDENCEIVIWLEDGSIFLNSVTGTGSFSPGKALKEGSYKWAVRVMNAAPSEPQAEFAVKRSFKVGTPPVEEGPFKKTGSILVIPIEFSDITFSTEGTADHNQAIRSKMDKMAEYYKTISWNADDAMDEVSYDVAPLYKSSHPRARYGKDVPTDKPNRQNLKFKVDAGDFGSESKGPKVLKKEAVEFLINDKKIPVRNYSHLIFIVPGGGGNSAPTDQIWPHSNSAPPSMIFRIPFTEIVTGTTFSGILMGIDTSVGVYAHEFGHQFGLPDLYPYHPNLTERSLGYAGLMASGANVAADGVGMTGLSKKRGYFSGSKKKDWLGKSRVLKASSDGSFALNSRDADEGSTLLLVPIKTTWDPDDYFVVEVFDRYRADKEMPAVVDVSGDKGSLSYAKPRAGVFIYQSDDDDVEDIKVLKTLPDDAAKAGKYFLTGGVHQDMGVKIEIDSLKDLGKCWSAEIKVSYEAGTSRPGGFVNTVKGIGTIIKNKVLDLFAQKAGEDGID